MNGTLGRDKIWNDQIWSDIDKAVREEVGRIRVGQKVFPTTLVNNVLPVAANDLLTRADPTGARDFYQRGTTSLFRPRHTHRGDGMAATSWIAGNRNC
jgi:hypothetical protein